MLHPIKKGSYMLERYLFLFYITIFSFLNIHASDKELEFAKNFNISDGLAHNGVTGILEDSKGYIWVSTYDGVNRYDGYSFKTYRNTLSQKYFSSNRIRCMMEDKNGNIWFGADEGVSVYNYEQESFNIISLKGIEREYATNRPEIRQIIEDKENGIVICPTENGGILVFNDDYTFDSPHIPPSNISKDPRTLSFYNGVILDKEHVLFSTTIGLITFNLETKKFKRFLRKKITNSLSIQKLDNNRLLVCGQNGISILSYQKTEQSYTFNVLGGRFQEYFFSCSQLNENGELWLGSSKTGEGIKVNHVDSILNPDYNQIFELDKSIGIARISYFFSVGTKGTWMGTFNKGIYWYNSKPNPFNFYDIDKAQKYGMNSEEVLDMSVYDNDRVFVVSRTTGLYFFNTVTHQFEEIPFRVSEQEREKVKAIYVDKRKNIWLGFRAKTGIYRVAVGTKEIKRANITFDKTFNANTIRSFSEDEQGNIWMATARSIYRVVVQSSNKISRLEQLSNNPFFKNKRLYMYRSVYADAKEKLVWLGSADEGLFRLDMSQVNNMEESPVTQFVNRANDDKSISSNSITSALRLPNDELWIGTEGGGVCKVINSAGDAHFIPYTEKDGLSNNVVKNIVLGADNSFWITTNIGLNKFNPTENRFMKYGKSDGLPFEDFWYSKGLLKNGVIILGGIKSFTYFNPDDLPDGESLPQIEFGELKLFNKTVMPGDTINDRVLLSKRLEELSKVELNADENVFSIELKSLHFSAHENHFLKYQLLPINEEWIEVPAEQRFVYYNGLPAGEYTLRMTASNSFNQWTEPKELKIIIHPPIWKTWYAILFYVILLALVTYAMFLFFQKVNTLKHDLEIEHLEKNNEKNVNDAKLRFFSNISHEIKTPLTLISGPINLLIERYKGNKEIADKLSLVQRQSKKISRLIDQVHDFQRSEAKLLDMNYSQFSFDDFINELVVDFKFLANTDDKELKIKTCDKQVSVYADKDKLEKVFNNLLNNAFKFTAGKDLITIEYKEEGDKLEVVVKDTGKGIDLSDLPHIFERFYQSQHKHSAYTGGSGIGLAFSKRLVEMHYGSISANSEKGVGTEFIISLPIIKEVSEKQVEIEQQVIAEDKRYDSKEVVREEEIDISQINLDEDIMNSRIFFAEDNTDMRMFVSNILSKFFEVKSFENGLELQKAMKEEWPDLVLSDVLMPEVNGFEVCKSIKTDIKTSHIPVVLLTACTAIDEQIQGLATGADAYIKKPFNTLHLISNIEAVLKNRKQLRERFQIEIPLNLNKTKDDNEDSVFVEKLYQLMDENLDNQQVDFNEMARQLYLNRTHFYQKVKAITNQTPFELIRMYRITKAAEFLSKDNLSVNEVFIMTGFKSRSHFTKLFKEKYHVTPGKFAAEALKDFNETEK